MKDNGQPDDKDNAANTTTTSAFAGSKTNRDNYLKIAPTKANSGVF